LIVANVFNIGADLGGMADATALVTGVKSFYWTPIFTVVIIWCSFSPPTGSLQESSNG